jgi:hypothetical protein
LTERLRLCFRWVEPFAQARKYMRAVTSELPTRNGWTIAEYVGDRRPDRTQRLLNRAVWDEGAAMAEVRRFAVAGLEEAARKAGRRRGRLVIGVLDETGQQKKGEATAGVKRRHLGCVGRVENGINTCTHHLLAELAPHTPSTLTLVPQTHQTRPQHREHPGQLANGGCRTSRPMKNQARAASG